MSNVTGVPCSRTGGDTSAAPAFHRGTFRVDTVGDTFLDTRGWGKGVVWVNGHNLGRFWRVGPQQTLLPGPCLRRGTHTITVFDLDVPERTTLRGLATPALDELHPDSARSAVQ